MLSRLHIVICTLLMGSSALAQFSPGELSAAHQQLEGLTNCLRCHEAGNAISGKKCLDCHAEIASLVAKKHGFHFRVSKQSCVSCHKEHLGRDAQTVAFDRKSFDHAQTGFVQTGKHAVLECERCHSTKNIRDTQILEIVRKTGRETYLGLSNACSGCHEDRHAKTVGGECQKCHTTSAWSPASAFDHARTRFALTGRHATVACSKCHISLEATERSRPVLFETKEYSDCTPCHGSPHSPTFSRQACRSCHVSEGWDVRTSAGRFNHDLTAFKLVGKHALVACEKCHRGATKSSTRSSLKLAHNACTDCHTDYHQGVFAERFNSRCEMCHTPVGFMPATFTVASHQSSRFQLHGAHAAVLCQECHVRDADGRRRFRFASLRCEACHSDKHGGQFANEMKERSCAACHDTDDWYPRSFDHARTRFPLHGRHAQIACKECHVGKQAGDITVAQYKGTALRCQSCHKDIHAGQFVVSGFTDCARCHDAAGWKQLTFDHNVHSTFALTGAHARIECRQCHREERQGSLSFIRFKPLQSTCESCHSPGSIRNG